MKGKVDVINACPGRKQHSLTANICMVLFSGSDPTRYPFSTKFSQRVLRMLILAQERLIILGRNTAEIVGNKRNTTWSVELSV